MRKCAVFELKHTVSILALFLCLCFLASFFAPAAFAADKGLDFDLISVINSLGTMEILGTWDNLVSVSVSVNGDFVLGLKDDGTVLAAGRNDRGQCNVSDWSDITKISAGNAYSLGLKSDGTALCAGIPDYDLTGISHWENLRDIDAGSCFAIGASNSGEQLFAGCGEFDINLWFQADTADKVWENKEDEIRFWNSLAAVRTAGDNILALDSNGELRYFGFTAVGDMPEFTKTIADFDVSHYNGAVLFDDGTALVWGDNSHGQCPSFEPNGISQLSLGASHSVFLRSDGTVFACGNNDFGQRDVSHWQNVCFIEAGDTCTLGITQDGELLVAGTIG